MLTDSEAALAQAVLIHGPVSRSALTGVMGLSPASLTRLAKPLLERGLLIELDDVAAGTVGRPSRPLDVAHDLGTFVGIKVTGDRLYAVSTDVRANPLAEIDSPLEDTRAAAVIDAIIDATERLGAPSPVGIGVSLGGTVRDGIAEFVSFLGWHDVPVVDLLEQRLGVPVVIENDIVALAEAERWFGVGRGIPGFSIITIGVGVGYGLVVDGRVIHSREVGIGLGGHVPLSHRGPVCAQGHRGCAQAMLSSGSIAAQVSALHQRSVGYGEALVLAVRGDPAAGAVADAAADALGRFVALAANLTLQPAVVLAGEGIDLYTIREERVRAAVAAGRDPRADAVRIHVDASGFTAWARGAAAVAIQSSFARMSLD